MHMLQGYNSVHAFSMLPTGGYMHYILSYSQIDSWRTEFFATVIIIIIWQDTVMMLIMLVLEKARGLPVGNTPFLEVIKHGKARTMCSSQIQLKNIDLWLTHLWHDLVKVPMSLINIALNPVFNEERNMLNHCHFLHKKDLLKVL